MHFYTKRLFVLLVFLCCSGVISAQTFYVDAPRKMDDFTDDFLLVLNDAPFNFSHVKGKALATKDTIHQGSKIFNLKVKLKTADASRLVSDSTIYTEFFFGDFFSMEDAFEGFEKLNNRISKALAKRSITIDYNLDTAGMVVKLQKMAYCSNRGFYHYNISFQIIRLLHNGKFRLMMQIYSGKPQFYYRIMRNEPVASFNLINSLKSNLSAIQNEYSSGCVADITPFVCKGKKFQNDSVFVTYQKTGFEDYPNARSEFDVYMTNLRVSLGSKYVYFMLPSPAKGPVFKRLAFVQMEDIEKTKRKTVLLNLVELPDQIPTPTGFKKQYAIEMVFVY